ncbi:MAG: HAD hydrolase family protein [Methanobrevibacter sp.]|uniref:HAD hydrolase family protein n=1 Tax=Methanobrevibacter sp. TaxID=66852 RepID=UPI0026E06D42|nr:HAD hydrolase family protein [Methanobrevibacter sp.]MDO5849016.1 HAD hydrolase family protein [Methanobrevibacter sp.]
MKAKSYITDCEGPLSLNDNAYELADHFIEDGGELFKTLSLYDDYLVDVVKKEDYKAGNTLKLILPFFLNEGITNDDMVEFSRNNIFILKDSEDLINHIKNTMNHYIVSTSYGQYIEALSQYMDFPFENTFFTDVDMDMTITNNEKESINNFKKQILENPENYELFDKIFFEEIPKMGFYNSIKDIEVVGGEGKKIAIERIIEDENIDQNNIFYIGDSITDVEPLEFAKDHGGISVSFNGNKYSLKAAEIAIVSPSAAASLLIADLYNRNDKDAVLKFIGEYNQSENIEELLNRYNIDDSVKSKFLNTFSNKTYPLIKIITDDNFDEILDISSEMRNTIRGQNIGELG